MEGMQNKREKKKKKKIPTSMTRGDIETLEGSLFWGHWCVRSLRKELVGTPVAAKTLGDIQGRWEGKEDPSSPL